MATCPYSAGSSISWLAQQAPVGPHVVRIGLNATAAHWEWLPCHSAPLPDAEERFPSRTSWREPPVGKLCCAPPRGCFRAVLDDVVAIPRHRFRIGQRVRCRNSQVRPSPSAGWQLGRVTSVDPLLRVRLVSGSDARVWDEVRPAARNTGDAAEGGRADVDDDPHARQIAESVRGLLIRRLGLRDGDVVVSRWQRQVTEFAADFVQRNAWHFDCAPAPHFERIPALAATPNCAARPSTHALPYRSADGQHSSGVYSAILYLAHDDEAALVGGHTAFVDTTPPPPLQQQQQQQQQPSDRHKSADEGETAGDETSSVGLERLPNGTAYLRRGLSVAPRIGRLVLFSGGSENYHAPMPIAQGRRQSLLVWFWCGCAEPE